MSADPIFRTTIRLCGVSKEFGAGAASCTGGIAVLDGVSVEIRGGEVLLVCGPPGAGKTTLLLCAAGLLHCDSGDVVRGRRVVYLDLARATPPFGDWPQGAAILLDSCDAVGELTRARVAHGVAAALTTGAALVLAARDPESAFAFAPVTATVSVLHLRLGRVTDRRVHIGVVHRVAEAGGGGY